MEVLVRAGRGRAGLDRKISTNLNDDDYYYGSHTRTLRETERERERQPPCREVSELKILTAVTHVLVGNI